MPCSCLTLVPWSLVRAYTENELYNIHSLSWARKYFEISPLDQWLLKLDLLQKTIKLHTHDNLSSLPNFFFLASKQRLYKPVICGLMSMSKTIDWPITRGNSFVRVCDLASGKIQDGGGVGERSRKFLVWAPSFWGNYNMPFAQKCSGCKVGGFSFRNSFFMTHIRSVCTWLFLWCSTTYLGCLSLTVWATSRSVRPHNWLHQARSYL